MRDNDKCIAEAQESTCQPRGKEILAQTRKQANVSQMSRISVAKRPRGQALQLDLLAHRLGL